MSGIRNAQAIKFTNMIRETLRQGFKVFHTAMINGQLQEVEIGMVSYRGEDGDLIILRTKYSDSPVDVFLLAASGGHNIRVEFVEQAIQPSLF